MSVKIHGTSLYEIVSANGERFIVPFHKIEFIKSRKNDSHQEIHLTREIIRVFNNDFEEIEKSMIQHAEKMDAAFSEEEQLPILPSVTLNESQFEQALAKRRGRPPKQ